MTTDSSPASTYYASWPPAAGLQRHRTSTLTSRDRRHSPLAVIAPRLGGRRSPRRALMRAWGRLTAALVLTLLLAGCIQPGQSYILNVGLRVDVASTQQPQTHEVPDAPQK